MSELKRNIKYLRKEQKYSQKELAELLDVSQTSVAHYEAGTRQPTIESLMLMSQIFDESIDALVGHTRIIYENKEVSLTEIELVDVLIETLLNKDERGFFQLFESTVQKEYEISEIIDIIFKSVLYNIGTMWVEGNITEADEHYATNIIRKAMNYISVSNADVIKDKVAVSFSVGSDKHTLGIEMINTYLETLGIRSLYLGSNLPIRSLDKLILDNDPDFILISITLEEHMNNLVHVVDYINEKYPNDFLIGIGGQGLRHNKDLEKHSNVHFISSVSELEEFVEL